MRKEKWRTGREVVEEEQLLVLANPAVVSLGGFLEVLEMRGKELLIGERNAVDSLQGRVLRVAQEIRSAGL